MVQAESGGAAAAGGAGVESALCVGAPHSCGCCRTDAVKMRRGREQPAARERCDGGAMDTGGGRGGGLDGKGNRGRREEAMVGVFASRGEEVGASSMIDDRVSHKKGVEGIEFSKEVVAGSSRTHSNSHKHDRVSHKKGVEGIEFSKEVVAGSSRTHSNSHGRLQTPPGTRCPESPQPTLLR